MWKKYKAYIIVGIACLLLGSAITVGAGYQITKHAGDKLNADLAASRTALADATRLNAESTQTISELRGQLASASNGATKNQQLISATESGLDELSSNIRDSGGDIGRQIQAIADGFDKLYKLYHQGTK